MENEGLALRAPETKCPNCKVLLGATPVPHTGPLRESIGTLLADTPEIFHTLHSIADCLQTPEATVRGLLHSMLLSREIFPEKHGPAVVYSVFEYRREMRVFDEAPGYLMSTDEFLYDLASGEPGETEHYLRSLADLVKDGFVERIETDKETSPGNNDRFRYRGLPVAFLE